MSRPCSSLPKKRGAKGKSCSSRKNRRSWTNAALPTAWPAHRVSYAHDTGSQSPTRQGNLGLRFSDVDSVSIARVLKLQVRCRSSLQECFPQKSGYCEKDRRAKILLSPRTSPGSE